MAPSRFGRSMLLRVRYRRTGAAFSPLGSSLGRRWLAPTRGLSVTPPTPSKPSVSPWPRASQGGFRAVLCVIGNATIHREFRGNSAVEPQLCGLDRIRHSSARNHDRWDNPIRRRLIKCNVGMSYGSSDGTRGSLRRRWRGAQATPGSPLDKARVVAILLRG